ncbi:unnamed protein product, partial [marine sediment metagenome]
KVDSQELILLEKQTTGTNRISVLQIGQKRGMLFI